jgi:hypothetical protein
MATPVTCRQCGAPLEIPDGTAAPWLECPGCGARLLNPDALRHKGPEQLTGLGLFGGLLVVFSVFFWCAGGGAIVGKALVAAFSRRDEGWSADLCVHTVGSILLFAVGALLLRAREDRVRKPFLLAAAGVTLLAAVMLLAVSGLIVIYVSCFVKG